MTAAAMLDGLPVIHREVVRPEWIDYNGHMNVAYFVLSFDLAIDAVWAKLGFDDDYRSRTGCSTFAAESHTTYQREMKLGDEMLFTVQILGYDAKRIHQFYRMYHAQQGYLAATCEWMSLHVNLSQRRVVPMPQTASEQLAVMLEASRAAGWPQEAGRPIRQTDNSLRAGRGA